MPSRNIYPEQDGQCCTALEGDAAHAAHAEFHYQPGIEKGSSPDGQRKGAEIERKQPAGTVELLKNLLRGCQIADEGTEVNPGNDGVAEGDGGAKSFRNRLCDTAQREWQTPFGGEVSG